MRCNSLEQAREQARANARRGPTSWVVLRDTNGQYHAESVLSTREDAPCVLEVFRAEPGA